jgi:hypothetical protein
MWRNTINNYHCGLKDFLCVSKVCHEVKGHAKIALCIINVKYGCLKIGTGKKMR